MYVFCNPDKLTNFGLKIVNCNFVPLIAKCSRPVFLGNWGFMKWRRSWIIRQQYTSASRDWKSLQKYPSFNIYSFDKLQLLSQSPLLF